MTGNTTNETTTQQAETRIERVISAVKAVWSAGADADLEASPYIESALEVVVQSPERRLATPSTQPATAYLGMLSEVSGRGVSAGLATALKDARDDLAWGEAYPELAHEPRYDSFRRNYAFAEIAGPRGLVVTDRISAFVTVQGPGIIYPAHAHSALEVYYIIAGTAQWQRGDEPWIERRPSDFVLHRSGVPHKTRTSDEPVLALAVWLDHLDGDSVMVADAAPRR